MELQIVQRFRRAFRCKSCLYYKKKWKKLVPEDFFRNPRRVMSLWYASREGHKPDFLHPRDFNQRLMSINLNAYYNEAQRDIRIIRADKYAVRQYIREKGFECILNTIYGVYDSFDEIDFSLLPDRFVIKITSGSGYNYICRDKSKINKEELRAMFNRWMEDVRVCGLTTGEWHYNLIKPRLIVERYLETLGESVSIVDYKFHCINGIVYGEYVCYDRVPNAHKVNYDHYDANWNLTDGVLPAFHPHQRLIPKPCNFERMKAIAQSLSEGLEYVRVDLYEIEGSILFGELTFTPMGNYLPYTHNRLVDMECFYKATLKRV